MPEAGPHATHAYRCVDVFSDRPLGGNPVAVVHDADDLVDEQMAAFARWTNLSETTFLLAASDPDADYRLRIFTPAAELPFAGHPTLGSAHAWLEAGGRPHVDDAVVQQCGAGLVRLRRDGDRLAFAGPPLVRSGPVADDDLAAVVADLGIDRADVVDAAWVDNGPGWLGLRLASAEAVLALRPASSRYAIGVVGPHPPGGDAAVEVRAFGAELGVGEDPVTGSLNAGLAAWLAGTVLPTTYVAAQGTAIGRHGRVHVHVEDDASGAGEGRVVWVAGDTVTRIVGELELGGGTEG